MLFEQNMSKKPKREGNTLSQLTKTGGVRVPSEAPVGLGVFNQSININKGVKTCRQ